MNDPTVAKVTVEKVRSAGAMEVRPDVVAVEEPLEIRVAFGALSARVIEPISVTMRTPGHDEELAAGFLLGEGIISYRDDVARIVKCGPETMPHRVQNVVRVELADEVQFDQARLERHFYTTSSCGVCGKTSLEAISTVRTTKLGGDFEIDADFVHGLPELLRETQAVFERTGGLHAAALFDARGTLIAVREDVGRHNAVDKLIGSQLLAGALPAADKVLLVSGRASFELVQKAVMAGVPMLAAVGAPSSLAVELAARFGMTLLGFVRNGSFNVYCGGERVRRESDVVTRQSAQERVA